MTDPRAQIHIRLSRPILTEVDHVRVDEGLDRAWTIELLLREALAARKKGAPA